MCRTKYARSRADLWPTLFLRYLQDPLRLALRMLVSNVVKLQNKSKRCYFELTAVKTIPKRNDILRRGLVSRQSIFQHAVQVGTQMNQLLHPRQGLELYIVPVHGCSAFTNHKPHSRSKLAKSNGGRVAQKIAIRLTEQTTINAGKISRYSTWLVGKSWSSTCPCVGLPRGRPCRWPHQRA